MFKLKGKILALTVLILCLALGLIYLAVMRISQRLIVKEKLIQARMVVNQVDSLLELDQHPGGVQRAPLWSDLLRSGVAYVALCDKSGNIVLSSGIPITTGPIAALLGESARERWRENSLGLLSVHPLKTGGALEIHFTLDEEKRMLRQANRLLVLYMGLDLLFLLLLAAWLWDRNVVRPVRALVQVAEQVATGKGAWQPVNLESSELDRLSGAIDGMVRKLENDHRTLSEQAESLKKSHQALSAAQAQLIQSEKMASIGQLAAGVAHEIGNPLSTVIATCDLLAKAQLSARDRQFTETMRDEALRIQKIIQDLLDFSRPPKAELRETSLESVIEETFGLVQTHPRFKSVALQMHLADGLPPAKADPSRIKQILVNLLFNAADALQGKVAGSRGIMISARGEAGGKKPVIIIEVRDNGPGMTPDVMRQAFEPFFSTKSPGQGTGLGLPVSRQIARALGGDLKLSSVPDEGTNAELTLEAWS